MKGHVHLVLDSLVDQAGAPGSHTPAVNLDVQANEFEKAEDLLRTAEDNVRNMWIGHSQGRPEDIIDISFHVIRHGRKILFLSGWLEILGLEICRGGDHIRFDWRSTLADFLGDERLQRQIFKSFERFHENR